MPSCTAITVERRGAADRVTLIGRSVASERMPTGRFVDAERALGIGGNASPRRDMPCCQA